VLGNAREISSDADGMMGAFLGPSYENDEIRNSLDSVGAIYHQFDENELIDTVAKLLADGNATGWLNGRMEFGPRSLGSRSILADPRSPNMQKNLNLKIKYRESFRPFAPSILHDDLSEWFELATDSPYMLLVANIRPKYRISLDPKVSNLFGINKLNVPRSVVPSITHVDYSARIQTVSEKTNAKYFKLLKRFKELTGVPILVNTSFNVRGEPIVCTVKDAFKCFMGTELDILVCGDFILYKNEQAIEFNKNYLANYELD
jgi:carbamoyltransferase